MNRTRILILLFLSMFLFFIFRCELASFFDQALSAQSETDDDKPKKTRFSLKGKVLDAKTNYPIMQEINVSLQGPSSDQISSDLGLADGYLKANNGQILLNFSSGKIKPGNVDLTIVANTSKYIPSSVRLTDLTGTNVSFEVLLVSIEESPKGVAVKEVKAGTADDTTGELQEDVYIMTDTTEEIETEAVISIPEGTVMKDNNGEILKGSLQATVAYFTPNNKESLASFPGGFDVNIENTNQTGQFVTAGFISIDIFDENGKMAETFENNDLLVDMEFPEGLINPETGQPLKEGDKPPVWSYNKTTGKWNKETDITRSSRGVERKNGKLSMSFRAPHLSYWNIDWFGTDYIKTSRPIRLAGLNQNCQIGMELYNKDYGFFKKFFLYYDQENITLLNVPSFPLTITIFNSSNVELGKMEDADLSGSNVLNIALGNVDITPPADVSQLSATPDDQIVTLTWQDPADNDLDRIYIVYSPGGSTPTEINPGTGTAQFGSLINNQEYSFFVFAVDTSGNKSEGVTISSSPVGEDKTPPGEITNLAAVSDDSSVTLTWRDPSESDFASVEITSDPDSGENTAAAGRQIITITGLSNGKKYTFTLKTVDTTGNKSDGVTIDVYPYDVSSYTGKPGYGDFKFLDIVDVIDDIRTSWDHDSPPVNMTDMPFSRGLNTWPESYAKSYVHPLTGNTHRYEFEVNAVGISKNNYKLSKVQWLNYIDENNNKKYDDQEVITSKGIQKYHSDGKTWSSYESLHQLPSHGSASNEEDIPSRADETSVEINKTIKEFNEYGKCISIKTTSQDEDGTSNLNSRIEDDWLIISDGLEDVKKIKQDFFGNVVEKIEYDEDKNCHSIVSYNNSGQIIQLKEIESFLDGSKNYIVYQYKYDSNGNLTEMNVLYDENNNGVNDLQEESLKYTAEYSFSGQNLTRVEISDEVRSIKYATFKYNKSGLATEFEEYNRGVLMRKESAKYNDNDVTIEYIKQEYSENGVVDFWTVMWQVTEFNDFGYILEVQKGTDNDLDGVLDTDGQYTVSYTYGDNFENFNNSRNRRTGFMLPFYIP